MKKIFVAAVAVLMATPALAQSASEARTKPQAKKGSKPAIVTEAPSRSAHSTNREYDVYFRGEYVGSDPDPRVRWTLRDEARRSYGLND